VVENVIRILGAVGLVAALLVPLGQPAQAAEAGRLVAVTDQQSENGPDARIRLLDPAVYNWNTAAALKWSWSPTPANGFSGLTTAWGLPSDVKLRMDRAGAYVAVVSDSRGLAGLITYPGGQRVWALNVGSANNPHSVELLPDGNVAVAASAGGFVRVYTASQGSSSSKYASYPLPDAHGVTWDPTQQVLWVLGGNRLVALKIKGTAAAPVLEESKVVTLPTGGGHDLTPVLENHDLLWVSTGSKVYQVSKSSGEVVSTENLGGIKSANSMPNAQQVRTTAKAGCHTSWCTDTVQFAVPAATRTLTGAQIYKARVWSSRYE
jgi:WD40 repeat protein